MNKVLASATFKSLFILFLALVIMIAGSIAYGHQQANHTMGGISPSEFSEPFILMSLTATGAGVLSLFVIALIWLIRCRHIRNQAEFPQSTVPQIRRSVLWIPLLVALIFTGGFFIHIASVVV